jgi:hypothetical protein
MAGRSGDRNPTVKRFSAPFQNGSAANPPFFTMDTTSFLGIKRPESGIEHPRNLAPRLKKE